jgi:Antitoxin of toxin-antitoxin, RelE / RelB, TA system
MLAPTREPMLHSEKFTDARSKFSTLFDEAVQDELPVVIARGGHEQGLLVARDALLRVLAPFQLHVDVLPEDDGAFTLWLRELDIGGAGHGLKEARGELAAAVCSYVRDYWQQFALYRHLPDMSAKEPYVLRLSLAETEQELLDVLFGPQATPDPTSPKPLAYAA